MSPEYNEVITGTITFQVSASGQRPDLEENNRALVLILVQGVDRPRRIQPPVCLAPQKQVNSELATKRSQHQTPTRKVVTRRKHEAQTRILALGALGDLPALALSGRRLAQL